MDNYTFQDGIRPNPRTFHAIVCRITEIGTVRPATVDPSRRRSAQKRAHLIPFDFRSCQKCCQWCLRQCDEGTFFSTRVLCTDDTGSTRNGTLNFRIRCNRSDVNPYSKIQSRRQQQFSIKVWAGIVGNCFLGPYVLSRTINGAV
jgi:hypothetical protein